MVDFSPRRAQLPGMEREARDLDLIFAALADPTRRAILTALLAGDRTVGELAEPRAMSLTAISKHLRILAHAGLVEQTRAGRSVGCRLLPDGLRAAGIWLRASAVSTPRTTTRSRHCCGAAR